MSLNIKINHKTILIMSIKNIFAAIALLSLLAVSCSKDDDGTTPINNEFVNIPDANFEAELINLGIDTDGVINQKVLRIDVKDIEYLDVSQLGASNMIEDLTGIEGFTNLKRLYAIANSLTSIDLSKNTKLDTLNLMSNDLKTIEGLSQATNLKWVNLSHNLFEEFTLDNPSVTNILMSHNELVSFNSSNATNLETVYLLTNKIPSIDFSYNPKLEAINVSNNKLTNLVLGTKSELYYLSLFENFIDHLDVSQFRKLEYLIADRNPNLPCIRIGNNQDIPSLQLSGYQEINENCD